MKLEQKSLFISMVRNFFIAVLKLWSGLVFNVFVLVTEAIYTFSDLITDILAIIALKFAYKRPNKIYPYGYGRIFYIIELFMALLSIGVGIFIIILSFKIAYQKPPLWIIVIIALCISLKYYNYHSLFKLGSKKHNDLLLASGTEAKMEIISNLVLVITIIVAQKYPKIDMLGSIIIVLILIWQALKVIRNNIILLIGISVDNVEIHQDITNILNSFPDILKFNFMLMQDGLYYHIFINIKLKRKLKVNHLIKLENNIRKELKALNKNFKFVHFQLF